MGNYRGKTVGFLGAVIVHLIAAIIFMAVQLDAMKDSEIGAILIELDENKLTTVNEIKEVVPLNAEEQYGIDEQIYNIARNTASVSEVKINAEEYIDKVKEELIKSGKLGADNYIDEEKRNRELAEKGETAVENTITEPLAEENNAVEKMASEFTGPTRIYYDLPGRYHTYLPIPIYKCEGSGQVTLKIVVGPTGIVIKADIIDAESTTSEECLVETAVRSALISRFNPDSDASRIQTGTITYHFVAQ